MNIGSSIGGPALALRSFVTARVGAWSPRQRRVASWAGTAALVAVVTTASPDPAYAQANLEGIANAVLGLLSNGLLRALAIIAVIVAGAGWLMGRVNTGALVTVIIGIAIIFSAPWIVDQIAGGG
ncbi:hypothetical protein DM480_17630 (plasmid) [Sphingomonas sp. FARSPH]|nr:hypothetical protein DM480_17630 [Sphingomonas sp. FARSPH]